MKNKIIVCVTGIALLLCGCEQRKIKEQLVRIDSLLTCDQLDSAYTRLQSIDTTSIKDDDERAYYILLKHQLYYRMFKPIPDERDLNFSIRHFQEKNEKNKLASAYYYKGMILYEKDKSRLAVGYIKQAEAIANKLSDLALSHKIYESLSTINYNSGNFQLALRYTKASLGCALSKQDSLWLAYAYSHLACLYEEMNQKDSAYHYTKKSTQFIHYLSDRGKAFVLRSRGSYYLQKHETDKAMAYFLQSFRIFPLINTAIPLARLYNQQGKGKEAIGILTQMINGVKAEEKVKLLQEMHSITFANGHYQEAFDLSQKLLQLKDSLNRYRQTEVIQEIQLKYDNEAYQRKLDQTIILALTILIVLVIIIASLITFHIYKVHRAKHIIMRSQVLINEYNREIHMLQESGHAAAKDIDELQSKIDRIYTEHTEVLYDGCTLYNNIKNGDTTAKWRKEDFDKFIEYYKVVNLPFVLQMEEDYDKLSRGNKFFLILQDMGKSDEEIMMILGISNGAIRTTRSRLRAKKNTKA